MKIIISFIAFLMPLVILQGQNESKLVIDASPDQTNNNPLIRLRNNQGIDLMWIHSDYVTNTFAGTNTGVKNIPDNGGISNTFIGSEVAPNNTSGGNNTGVGYAAMNHNITGSYNTAIGSLALLSTTGSQYNTAIGYAAGRLHDNGYNNVFIGANTDVDASGLYNVIAMGQGTVVTASSTARFGNSATGSYGGWADWSNVSDGRFKKNVTANVVGLAFIMKLNPVTYNLDVSGLSAALNENQGREWDQQMKQAIADKEKVVQSGFIAQDVEKVAKEVGYNFSGVDAPKNDHDFYGLRYAEFVVPLVKAVQELNEKMLLQNIQIEAENKQLADRLQNLENMVGMGKEVYSGNN
ncbi:MAG: tail fiber domain-containing protein [Saprospiraceae bacterium]|nr:tail fiber domain-containing protein [Saprospiraceae bacterium]